MAERTIRTKLLVRTDTSANWESENPILQANEFGFDSTVQAFKKGDGTTTWNSLDYVTDTRLLKKLEKATDSDKLDGQDGSYYLNYNNLSNKPSIPNVSNKVDGASSSTDNAIVRFNGTGGKTIQNSGVTIDDSNNLTTKGMIKIQNGSASGSFVLGADVNATTLTTNQRKLGRMGVPSYDSTTKTIAGISFDSQANVNLADFGGHPNNTSSIAPDVIRFTVANEHNNSVSGTRKLALQIANQNGLVDSAGGGTSVKGAKFFVPVQTTSGIENTGQVSSSQGFVHTGVAEANRSTSLLLANGSSINTTSFQNAGNYVTNVKVGNTSYEPSSGVVTLPSYPTVPTKLSALTNDSGFITNTVSNLTNYYTKTNSYTKTEVNNLINSISTFNALIVTTLPSSNISTTTIYLVSKSDTETDDYYDEYMYINNAWEMIGNTKIDLSNYYKKSETFNKTEINSLIETLGNELDGKANKTEISNENERVYLVIGNTTGTAGTWTGTNERITSYFDGLLINYKIGIAGASTTTLNINGLGAKTIYLRGTTKLTTHYEVGTMVLLSYNSSKGAFYSADYDANSYAYVRQYTTTTSAEYPMLMAYETSLPSSYDTKYVRKNSTIKANPSTGTITATTFKGSLNGNATSSTKATQDGNGNVISETYATKEELENASGGTIDDSNYAKLNGNNNFTGNNTFVGQLTFQDLLIPSGSGMQVEGVFADKTGNVGSSGQVLTSTGTGVKWTTPSASGGSSVTSYPEIALEDSIYTDHSGTLSQNQYDAIIEAGGFISSIEKEGEGLNTPFLIDFSYETDLRLTLTIQQPQDNCIYYVCIYINKETLEYSTEYYYGEWLTDYSSGIFWQMLQFVDITNGIKDWQIEIIQNNPTLKVLYNGYTYVPTQYNYDIEYMSYSCIYNNNNTTFCKSLSISWGHKSITQYECNLTGGVYDLLSLNIDLSSNSSGTLTLTIVSQLQGKEKIKIGTSNLYAILNFSSEYDIGETRNIITYSGCVGTDGGVKQIYFVIYPDNTYQVTVKSV